LKTDTRRILTTPEGTFIHDRDSGLCTFTPKPRSPQWTKPLFAQIAITEKCNMNPPCPWCYAKASPNKSRTWPVADLMELVKFLDLWDGGLLGVAYGGGEPFTHPDIVEIVKRTWNETGLDVSLTTNGLAVSPDALASIEGYVGEIRVSIYDRVNCWLLEKFLNRRFDLGVNILLVNGGIDSVEKTVETCVEMGIRDFLINSLLPVNRNGKCRDKEPNREDYSQLAKLVEKYENRAQFRVSTRTAETLRKSTRLQFVPFANQAKGRIVAITVDRKVKPSSMSTEAYPFNEPEEIPTIYRNKIAP